jgi:hypothetical protein
MSISGLIAGIILGCALIKALKIIARREEMNAED